MTDNDPSERPPPLTIKEAVSFIDQEMKLWFAGRASRLSDSRRGLLLWM